MTPLRRQGTTTTPRSRDKLPTSRLDPSTPSYAALYARGILKTVFSRNSPTFSTQGHPDAGARTPAVSSLTRSVCPQLPERALGGVTLSAHSVEAGSMFCIGDLLLTEAAGDRCLGPSRIGLTSSQVSLISTRGKDSHTSMDPEPATSAHSISQDRVTPISSRNRDALFSSRIGCRDSDPSAEVTGGTAPKIDDAIVQDIMGKVRDRLGNHTPPAAGSQESGSERDHTSSDPNHWVLDNSHLAMIVETVLEEARWMRMLPDSAFSYPDKSFSRRENTVVKRPSLLTNTIQPQAPAVADPATTISQPQAALLSRSLDSGRVCIKVQSQETKTTIVSRRSITDIKWLHNANETAITRWGPLESIGSTDNRRLSACDSKFSVSTLRGDSSQATPANERFASFRGFSGSQKGATTPQGNLKENSPTGSTTPIKRFSLESFPALMKREDTDDWLSPPADLSTNSLQQERDDMYHLGIDARSGSVAPIPTFVIDEPVKPRQCNRDLFHEDIFDSGTYSIPVTRRATEASIKTPLSPELSPGISLGKSSRKLRGTGTGRSGISFIPVHKHEPGTPHFMDRLREGGKTVTRKLSAVFQGPIGGNRGTRAPAPSAESEDHAVETPPHGRKSVTRNTIDYLDPLVSYATSTTRRSYHETCSEDHQPHQCENDFSPKISPARVAETP